MPRGVLPEHSHFASTLKRAVHKEPTRKAVALAERATLERWLTRPSEIAPDILEDVYVFSKAYFGKPDGTPTDCWHGRKNQVSYPLPSGNACIGSTKKQGGTARALSQWMKGVRMDRMFHTDDPSIRLEPPRPARDPANPWANPEGRREEHYWKNVLWTTRARIERDGFNQFLDDLTSDPTEDEIAHECMAHVADLKSPPDIKVASVKELGGKIRGISLHPPQVTHAARCLGNRMIASVKRKFTVKEPLFNKPFDLVGGKGARLVSADLSKATDYFQHSLTQAIVLGCADAQGWSQLEIDAAMNIYGPQRLEDGRVTQTGVHMGLAGTWAILNVANAYAATRANSDPRSNRQCGDDLIGLFTPAEEELYRTVLTQELQLKYNMRKSWVGECGRFCENHVKITYSDDKQVWARCEPAPKVAEAVGAQELYGFTNNPAAMVPGLGLLANSKVKYVRTAARQSLERLEKKLGLVPNIPLAMGGSGRKTSKVSESQVNAVLRYMRTGRGINQTGQLPEPIRQRLSNLVPDGKVAGKIKVKDLRVHKLSMVAREMRLGQGEVLMADSIPKAVVKRTARAMQRDKGSSALSQTFRLKKVRSRVRNLSTIRNRLRQDSKYLRKVANCLVRYQKELYISKERAYALLKEDWTKCRRQNGELRPLLGLDPPASAE